MRASLLAVLLLGTCLFSSCLFSSGAALAASPSWEPTGAGADLYKQGHDALLAKDPRAAEAAFRKLLAREPQCGLGLQGLGYALLYQNHSREALTVLQSGTALFPDQPDLQTTLSEAAFAAQDFALARQAANRALQLNPESMDAEMALQAVLLRSGDYAAAGQALGAAQIHLPGPELACLDAELRLEEGETAAARELLTECRSAEREDLVTTVEGLLAQASGDTQQAGQLMGALGADSVSDVVRAADLYHAGDAKGALALLDGVLKQYPDRVDARIIRGQCRAQLGDTKGARADLEQAFKGQTWVEVHKTGMMSGILRKSDEAKLNNMVLDGAALLVRLLADDKDFSRAEQVLATAKASGPTDPDVISAEAWLLAAEGNAAGAWKVLSDALLRGSQDPILRETAALLTTTDLKTAPPVVLAAIRAQGPAHARYNLAAALLHNGRPADCLAEVVATPPAERAAMAVDAQRLFDELAWTCAVEADDLEIADARLALLGAPDTALGATLFGTGFNHALLLEKAGRQADALALLGRLTAPDKRAHQKALSLQISLSAGLGQWDTALAKAADPDADPQDLAWLAGGLADVPRTADAIALLQRACPQLKGNDATQCTALLTQVSLPP